MANLFSRGFRDPGTYTSAAVAVDPAQFPDGYRLTVTPQLDAADLTDPALTVAFEVQRAPGAGGPWSTEYATAWTGGGTDRSGAPAPAPVWVLQNTAPPPPAVRALLTVSRRVRIGLDVTVDGRVAP